MPKLNRIQIGMLIGLSVLVLTLMGIISVNYYKNNNVGASVISVYQGGTGAQTFNAGECLKGNGTGAVTTGACGGGGGGGSDSNWNFLKGSVYPATTTNQVLIGNSATTTIAQLEVRGNGWAYMTYASTTALTVSGTTYLGTATTTASNGFNISAGCFAVGGTCVGGSSMTYPGAGIALSTGAAWGASIADNSGNWNTAFGWGNHASAGYLTGVTSNSPLSGAGTAASHLIWTDPGYLLTSNFGTPFYTFFHATSTDFLSEGTTNLYYTNTRANLKQNALNFNPFSAGYFTATSTGTSTFANISSWGLLSATYFHSTSTATSTFAGGINMTSGCFAVNGTCVGAAGGANIIDTLYATLGAGSDAGGLNISKVGRLTANVFNATSTTATSSAVNFYGEFIGANYLEATSTATSTISKLKTTLFNLGTATTLSDSATSTFSKGINLTSGCFAINGTCVSGSGSASMATLTDVSLGALNWGDFLYFDTVTMKWKNAATSTIGFPTDLNGLSDVTVSSVSDAQLLIYSGTPTFQWLNKTMTGNCSILNTGAITCFGGSIGATDMAVEDFGSFSCTGGAGGCTVDASAISNTMLANSAISGVSLGSNLANLTALNTTLTFSVTYNGSAAATIELNLGNANTWTALQQFSNATSTLLTATQGWFTIASTTTFTLGGAGTITSKGSLNASGAVSFAIPSSASVTPAAIGQIGIDTTSDQLKYYGTAARTLVNFYNMSFNVSSSTWGTGTTTVYMAPAPSAITIVSVRCETSAGTLGVQLYDGTNRANWIPTASTTISTFTYSTNNTFTDGESMRVDVGTAESSPTAIGCRFRYTYTPN